MKRNVEKHFMFTREEAEDLKRKSEQVCMTESGLIRLLVKGCHPKEKPDERFYESMRELSSISNNINQIAAKANKLNFIDPVQLKDELKRLHRFQKDIEKRFLSPDEGDM